MRGDQRQVRTLAVRSGWWVVSKEPVLRALIEDVTAVGIVLVERGGGNVAALAEPCPDAEMRDVSVSTAGVGAIGRPARLRARADDLARAMPR